MAYLTILVELHSATVSQATVLCLGLVLCGLAAVIIPILWVAWCELQQKHACQQRPIVIEIDSSPEPTRMPTTPFWEEDTKATPMTRRRARRGGGRRLRQHARSCTRTHNPVLPHHCAYQCLLKAANSGVAKDKISSLRKQTAHRVYHAYVNGAVVHGIDARDVVASTGCTLSAYLADVEHEQWASPLEVALAADSLNLKMMIVHPYGKISMHERPTHIVKLKNQHWTLHKAHKVPTVYPNVPRSQHIKGVVC